MPGHPARARPPHTVRPRASPPPGRRTAAARLARPHGIQVQAWGALARGRFTSGADSPAARLVADLALRKGTTPETVLLWWLQRHPAAVVPVVGTTRPGRILACRDAVHRAPDLSREEWYELWVDARGAPLP
ncbi:hypothetical protein [Streptomyces tendae]